MSKILEKTKRDYDFDMLQKKHKDSAERNLKK